MAACIFYCRVHDDSRMGFNEWGFLTTHNWGEESDGEWLLEISNGYRAGECVLESIVLPFYFLHLFASCPTIG